MNEEGIEALVAIQRRGNRPAPLFVQVRLTAMLERTSPKKAVLAMVSHQGLNAGTHVIQKVVERYRHQQRALKL